MRPVLLVDEAQEIPSSVLSELRLLSSMAFDSRAILTVVLAGDPRLAERLRSTELVPLESRIRTRLRTEAAGKDELARLLDSRMAAAGNAALMTPELVATLAERSLGNVRAMLNIADELLCEAQARDLRSIDEKLFLELCPITAPAARKTAQRRA